MTTVGRNLRVARAAVFAAACAGLSAAGHVWMSGPGIALWALALAFAGLTACGCLLAGRQRGFLSISALMLLGELGQHLLFTAAQRSPAAPAIPAFVSGRVVPASAWICGDMHGMHGGTASHSGLGMITAHGAAGLLCAWWLRNGEAAVFRLLRILAVLAAPALLIHWPATIAVPDFPRNPASAEDHVLGRCNRLLSAVLARRGPPRPRICTL